MMNEKSKKAYKAIARFTLPFAMLQLLAFLGVPLGLIFWMFNPIGWKITVGSIIILPFLILLVKGLNKGLEDFKEEHEDEE